MASPESTLTAGPITPASPILDLGQSVSLSTAISGGTPPYVIQWYAGTSATCSLDSSIAGATSTSYTASPSSSTYYCYSARDSASPAADQSSSTNLVGVNPRLTAGGATPSSPTIDLGQFINLTAAPSGGTPPYGFQWYTGASATCTSNSAIGGATTLVYTASPTSAASYCYVVSDSATTPGSAMSGLDPITVGPALVAGAVTPTSPLMDQGQSITLTTAPSGGTPPYAYQWYAGASATCLDDSAVNEATFTTVSVSPSVSTYYCYALTDAASGRLPYTLTSATDLVTVNSAPVAGPVTPVSPILDSGQSVTLTANPSGGSGGYGYQWYAGDSSTCSSDSAITGATGPTYSVAPATGTYYCYIVTDHASGTPAKSSLSATDLVAVNPVLAPGVVTPSSPTVDSGRSINLTANPSGGTAPYTIQWFAGGSTNCLSDSPAGTSAILQVSPTTATYYCYEVEDSSVGTPAAVGYSPTDLVSVNLALTAGAVTPASPKIDQGQAVTLTANPAGGTVPYTFQWYTGNSATCSSNAPISGATGSTYQAIPTANASYCYVVSDSSGGSPPRLPSALDTVTVNATLVAGGILPNTPTISSGGSVTLTAHVSGGIPPYSIQWYSGKAATCSSDAPIAGATGVSYSASPTVSTYYCYNVTDGSVGVPVGVLSATDLVTVTLAAGALSPAAPTIDLGQFVILTANVVGGTLPYTYSWSAGNSATCSSDTPIPGATASSYSASPTANKYYCYQVTDSASSPATATSATDLVSVNPALAAGAITPGSPKVDNGQSVTLTAHASGGTVSYQFQWYSGTASTCSGDAAIPLATGQTYSAAPTSTTTYCYAVTDSATSPSTVSSAVDRVVVNSPLAAGSVSPGTPVIDGGQSITLTANPSGGTLAYAFQWFDGTSANCLSDTAIAGATQPTYTAVWTGPMYYCYSVTDNATTPVTLYSAGDAVTVDPALTAGTVSPNGPTISVGGSVTLTASPGGGTGSYTVQWYSGSSATCASDTPIAGATGLTYGASPSTSIRYCYNVTDGSVGVPVGVLSLTDLVTVTLAANPITPAAPTVDSGQPVTLTAHVAGGTPPYSYQWYSGTSATCSLDTAIGGATSVSLITYPSATTDYCYSVSDSASPAGSASSAVVVVTWHAGLTAGTVSPSTPTLSPGHVVNLTANPSGGTTPYAYQWYSGASVTCAGDSSISGATGAVYAATPAVTTYFCYQVTDSAITPSSQFSGGDLVTVTLTAGAVTPTAPKLDPGQPVTLVAHLSGGTPPYVYQWYAGTSATCTSDVAVTGGTSSTLTVTPSSSTYYCYQVTDSASSPASVRSATDPVAVGSSFSAGSVTPTSPTIDASQSVTLTAHPSGGWTQYQYQWSAGPSATCSLDTAIPGATAATYTAAPTGSAFYCYSVTDNATVPETASSAGNLVTVNATLTAGPVTPASPILDTGQSIVLTANPSGGTPPYQYQWYSGGSASCASDTPIGSATSPTLSPSPSTGTYYCYEVTDSAAGTPAASAFSATDLVAVNPGLVAGAVTPGLPTIDDGQSVTLTANPSGGTGPYHYQWYAGSSATCTANAPITGATNPTLVADPTATTSYCYVVTDSAVGTPAASAQSATDAVTVDPALVAGAVTPGSPAIDSGQSVTLTAAASGGTPAYHYQWYAGSAALCSGDTAISGATGTSYTAAPTTGTYYCYRVTDASVGTPSGGLLSATDLVTVSPALTAGSITPASPTLDDGQSLTLTAHASGGTPVYSYQWFAGGSPTCSSDAVVAGATSATLVISPTSGAYYCYRLNDSSTGSPVASTLSAVDLVTVNTALAAGAPTPTSPTIDTGQSVTLTAHASQGTPPYSYQWYTGSSATCSSDAPVSGATSSTYSPSPTVNTTYCYVVTDSSVGLPAGTASPTDVVVVDPHLVAGAVTPTSPTIDNGQSVTLTAHISGGTPTYAVQWYAGSSATCTSDTAISGATSLTLVTSPASGTYYYCYKVTDSATTPVSVTSTADVVTVGSTLAVGAITPASPTIDLGQSVTLTTHPSGGTVPYSYQWYTGSSATCTSDTLIVGATASTFAASPTANTSYCYTVTDSASTPVTTASGLDAVVVDPALVAAPVSPTTPTLDSGQSVSLATSASGGTPPYSYQWYAGSSATCSSDTSISGATGPTDAVTPTASTYYCYKVTDGSGGTPSGVLSATDLVTVNPRLAAGAVTPGSPTIDSGQSVTLTAHASGGTTPYSVQWYAGSSTTCLSDSPVLGATGTTYSAAPTSTMDYCYAVTDSAPTPVSVASATIAVTVNSPLAAGAVGPSSPTIDSGQSVTLGASASGGTPPYSYQWYAGSSATCTSETPVSGATSSTYSPSPTVNTTYCYVVADSATGTPAATAYSATDVVLVNPHLVAGAVTPASPTIDNGQSVTLTAHISGGTPSYAVQWYAGSSATCTSDTAISGATSLTLVTSPASGTYYYCYKVTDSATTPVSVTSTADAVVVNLRLAAGAVTPGSPTIDSGQTVTLSVGPSGGTVPYSYQWYTGSSATCTSDTLIVGATASTFVASPTASTSYCYVVTDSATVPTSAASGLAAVTVNGPLVASGVSPTSPRIDNGQTVTLTAGISGGTTPYTVQWYTGNSATCSSDTAIAGATGSSYAASPTATTYYCYKAADASVGLPNGVLSTAMQVTVNPRLAAETATPASPTIDDGNTITLAANPVGGTAPYSFVWYSGTASSCTSDLSIAGATGATYAASPTANTTYCYTVTDSATTPVSETSGTMEVVVNPTLTVGAPTPTTPTIDSGQSVTFTLHVSGGTPPYSYQWYSGSSATCSSDTAISKAVNTTLTAAPTSSTYYCYKVADGSVGTSASGGFSGTDLVTVDPALLVGAVTPASPSIDGGQSVTLSVHVSGGTGSYSYLWYAGSSPTCQNDSALSGATSATEVVSPTASTYYCYKVTDGSVGTPAAVYSATDLVTANPALGAGALTPTSPAIDTGQSVTLTAHVSGGTEPFSFVWYSGTTSSCSGDAAIAGATGATYAASPTANTTYCYTVTDSATTPVSETSGTTEVVVNPALVVGAITPASPTIDAGQVITLSAHLTNGTPPYSYQWYSGSSAACSSDTLVTGASAATYAVFPSTATYYCYKASDASAGASAGVLSATDLVSVNPALVASPVAPASPVIDAGQSITLTGNGSGGSGPYSYQWYAGSSAACSSDVLVTGATSHTYTVSPASGTYYCYKLTDSAPSPFSVLSSTDPVTVNARLAAGAPTPTSATVDNGQSVTLAAAVSGGSAPFTYTWYAGTSSTCSSDALIPGATGSTYVATRTVNTTYCYAVTDHATQPVTATSGTTLVVVNPVLAVGAVTPGSPTMDAGQSLMLTAHPSGGTLPYTYQWYEGISATCTSGTLLAGAASSTLVVAPTTNTTYCVAVSDSATTPSVASSATVTVHVEPALVAGAVTPASPTIDLGQSITFVSHPSGGTTPYAYQWYAGSSPSCSADSAVTLATSASYTVQPTAATYYCYQVTDASVGVPTGAFSTTDLVATNPALVAGAVTPATPALDAGQSVTLAAHPSGGTGTYTYQWYAGGSAVCASDSAVVGATGASYAAAPTTSTYYCYQVTDSATVPVSLSSATDLVTANPALGAGAVTPAIPEIDPGQTVTLTANPVGGTSPFSFQWYTGSLASCASNSPIAGATAATYAVAPSANTSFCYVVTDSAPTPETIASALTQVVINPVLVVGAISPATPTIDDGQSVSLTAHASGGTTPYSYQWYSGSTATCSSGTAIPGATGATYDATPAATGYYCFKVTDGSVGVPTGALSGTDEVMVSARLQADAFTPGAPTIDTGQSVALTAHAAGGTGTFSYQWYAGSSTDCSSDTAVPGQTSVAFTVSPAANTYYCYKVTDASQGSPSGVYSATGQVTVNAALVVGSATPATPSITSGQSITLTAGPSAGSAPYTYQWYAGTSATCADDTAVPGATGSTLVVSPTVNTYYCYSVTDSSVGTPTGSGTSATDLVSVSSPSPAPSFLGLPVAEGVGLLLVIVVVIGFLLFLLLRPAKKPPTTTYRTGEPPEQPSPEGAESQTPWDEHPPAPTTPEEMGEFDEGQQ